MTILVNFGFNAACARGIGGWLHGTAANNKIEIYSGTILDDADDWVEGGPGSPSELLVTFDNFRVIYSRSQTTSSDVTANVFRTTEQPDPNPVNATATGTATWFAMYDSVIATDGPLLGNVSTSSGTAILQLDSLSIVSGNPVTITHFGFKFGPGS